MEDEEKERAATRNSFGEKGETTRQEIVPSKT